MIYEKSYNLKNGNGKVNDLFEKGTLDENYNELKKGGEITQIPKELSKNPNSYLYSIQPEIAVAITNTQKGPPITVRVEIEDFERVKSILEKLVGEEIEEVKKGIHVDNPLLYDIRKVPARIAFNTN